MPQKRQQLLPHARCVGDACLSALLLRMLDGVCNGLWGALTVPTATVEMQRGELRPWRLQALSQNETQQLGFRHLTFHEGPNQHASGRKKKERKKKPGDRQQTKQETRLRHSEQQHTHGRRNDFISQSRVATRTLIDVHTTHPHQYQYQAQNTSRLTSSMYTWSHTNEMHPGARWQTRR